MNGINIEKNKDEIKGEGFENEMSESKALVPVFVPDTREIHSMSKRFRKKTKGYIFYIRIYLLFFFAGACLFASGRWGFEKTACKVFEFFIAEKEGVFGYFVEFAPLIFGSFVVYASGFTIYAPISSFIYSATVFFLGGLASGSIIYTLGTEWQVFFATALIGVSSACCVVFCSVSNGISKIASNGIGKLPILDGILFSVLYWGYVFVHYFILKGIEYFLL